MKASIDYFKKFRTNLQLLRIANGYSAEQLSVKIGLSKKRITDFEYGKKGRGTPRSEEIFKLAKLFKVSGDDLVFKTAKIILE